MSARRRTLALSPFALTLLAVGVWFSLVVLARSTSDKPTLPGYFSFQQHDPGSKVSLRKIEVMELPNTTGDK